MACTFTPADGLIPVDLIHCGLDHLTASEFLFEKGPHLFDSAGYLAHLGLEMLLKGWLLESLGSFEGVHSLKHLYSKLVGSGQAAPLDQLGQELLEKLDSHEQLRYPNRLAPTEIGSADWADIQKLASDICRSMPKKIEKELETINSGPEHEPMRKAGRVLMKKKVDEG